VRPVSGGDIHRAFRVEGAGQRFFIKDNPQAPTDIFALEASGLASLREAAQADDLIKVPEVLAVGNDFLVLEWLDFANSRGKDSETQLGAGLASIHQRTTSEFGWHEDNYIGTLSQRNSAVQDSRNAARFFAERRLFALVDGAEPKLPNDLISKVERLIASIDSFLPTDQPPSLLHGDLWGGNWSTDSKGQPWIYDPAVYFGCREAELAFTELFGGFGPTFYAAYEERFPLEPGYRNRVDIWNLYPLLVHARLCGGGYIQQVNQILHRLVG
jgi:fructosamine-3-kinase